MDLFSITNYFEQQALVLTTKMKKKSFELQALVLTTKIKKKSFVTPFVDVDFFIVNC